jgi:glycosyltransferase involved in cell wall biosynthesis
MKLIIDIQSMQSESKYRGIGTYSFEFTKSILKNAGSNEVILIVNDLFDNEIEEIINKFDGLILLNNIRTFSLPSQLLSSEISHSLKIEISKLLREHFIAQLNPDIVHICSLFEGYLDQSITSIKYFDKTPTTITLYDLIPLINSDVYLNQSLQYKKFYYSKLNDLLNADVCLSISNSTIKESNKYLGESINVAYVGTGINLLDNNELLLLNSNHSFSQMNYFKYQNQFHR